MAVEVWVELSNYANGAGCEKLSRSTISVGR